ncbi:hypothetical protein D9M70_572050 [compost metagenome]
MLLPAFHSGSRNDPDFIFPVEFIPARPADFIWANHRQDQQLGRTRSRTLERVESNRQSGSCFREQGSEVGDTPGMFRQELVQVTAPPGWVLSVPQSTSSSRIKHEFDPVPYPRRSYRDR